MSDGTDQASPEVADPDRFREPTPREHLIAAALFVGFGLFFFLLFIVSAGFWFRWVVVGLGVISIWHGVSHARDARRPRRSDAQGEA